MSGPANLRGQEVFYVMDFIVHYDDTRGGIGWQELKEAREMLMSELLEIANFDLRVWASNAKVGEYKWQSVERYLARIR